LLGWMQLPQKFERTLSLLEAEGGPLAPEGSRMKLAAGVVLMTGGSAWLAWLAAQQLTGISMLAAAFALAAGLLLTLAET